ncbi:hypothetical protein R20233_00397 [Ralstonia sp. LMG 32965]|uniref:hypothetical protein n=1 Tax=Ralstonia flatus TaxID=3058601 RepID=UPI0028F61023|nr:hypothetical protein [Ralstonia sp. LMG 32965]CAJ0856333.1 hypothetical protein R20233_00397 [Ralstonia sp. LMG 32965]
MYAKTATAAAIACALSGCTALPQSALIYSSRSTVGISLTSNPASSSGITISAGVDVMDAAYVPVAVTAKGPDGASASASVLPIQATYGSLDGKKDSGAPTRDDNIQKIDEYVKALNGVKVLSDQVALLKERDSLRKASKDAKTTTPATLPSNVSPAGEQAKADSGTKADKDLRDFEAKYPNLTGDLPTVMDQLDKAQADANQKRIAAAEAVGTLQQTKLDAYSVYGRFDGHVSGGSAVATSPDGKPAPSASVALLAGKIFSTGVASQNLTEAARIEATMQGFTHCIASANTAVAGLSDDREKYQKRLLDACVKIKDSAK